MHMIETKNLVGLAYNHINAVLPLVRLGELGITLIILPALEAFTDLIACASFC